MPAQSQKQMNLMRACGHGANYPQCQGIRSSMGPKIRDFMHMGIGATQRSPVGLPSFKSHMPKGATQSPKGDLGHRSDQEYDSQRHFKGDGGTLSGADAFGSHTGTPGSIGAK